MSFLRNIPIVRNFLGAGEEERPAAPPARSSPLAAASPFVGVGFGSPAAAAAPSQPAPFTGFGSPSPADRALSGPSLADRERYLASRAPAPPEPPRVQAPPPPVVQHVLEINVADEQVEDIVDDAIQYFNERHFDGVGQVYF